MFNSLMFKVFVTSAHAQATAAPGQPNSMLSSFLPLVLVGVIFYFLMLRPQKKQLEAEQALLSKLAKGDEVYTKSGFIGTITGLNEKIVDLEVSEGVRFKVLRNQIAGLAKSVLESEKK